MIKTIKIYRYDVFTTTLNKEKELYEKTVSYANIYYYVFNNNKL